MDVVPYLLGINRLVASRFAESREMISNENNPIGKLPPTRYLTPGGGWDNCHRWYYAIAAAGLTSSFGRACVDVLSIVAAMTRQKPQVKLTRDYLCRFAMCSRDKMRRVIGALVDAGMLVCVTVDAQRVSEADGDPQKHCFYSINYDNEFVQAGLAFDNDALSSFGRDITSDAVAEADAVLDEISEHAATYSDIDYINAKIKALETAKAALEAKQSSQQVSNEKSSQEAEQVGDEWEELAEVDVKRSSTKSYRDSVAKAWKAAKAANGVDISEAVAAYMLYTDTKGFAKRDGEDPDKAIPMSKWLTEERGLPTYVRRLRDGEHQSHKPPHQKPLPKTVPCPYCGEEMRLLSVNGDVYSSCANNHGPYRFGEIIAQAKRAAEEGGEQ